MLHLFRRLRRDLIDKRRIGNYLLYALGEILLVVVGILIALQVNNWNDARKARAVELEYLSNIRADLTENLAEIDRFISARADRIADAAAVVSSIESEEAVDAHEFNARCIHIYEWRRFSQINFTFEELLNSGKLALISNDGIKSSLLRLESAYKKNKAEEDHFRFDAEELLYKPLYEQVDLHPLLIDFESEAGILPQTHVGAYRLDPRFKSGFLMAILELSKLNEQLGEMRGICNDLVDSIDAELEG